MLVAGIMSGRHLQPERKWNSTRSALLNLDELKT